MYKNSIGDYPLKVHPCKWIPLETGSSLTPIGSTNMGIANLQENESNTNLINYIEEVIKYNTLKVINNVRL